MSEPQAVLVEALHAVGRVTYRVVPLDIKLHAAAIIERLAARGYALVRTPETLDVPGLLSVAASPAPAPGAGLREAWIEAMRQVHARHDLGHKIGAWPNACALCEAHRAVAALAASPAPDSGAGAAEGNWEYANRDGIYTAPSAEPPETT